MSFIMSNVVNITGNAATATNVPYAGLTGIVPTWNQSTTGTAANATNAGTAAALAAGAWASPGAIGGTAPGAGAFTTLAASGKLTLSGTSYANFTGGTSGAGTEDWVGSDGGGGLFINTPSTKTINLGVNNAVITAVSSTGLAVTGVLSATTTINTGGYTVATLPAGVTGARAYVTNALAPVWGSAARCRWLLATLA